MDDILDLINRVFGLSAPDKASLFDAIKQAILACLLATYLRWATFVGTTSTWLPSQDLLHTVDQQAQAHAESIAATYEQDLVGAVSTYLTAWQQANGNLQGVEGPLATMLDDWTSARGNYKSIQIAGFEGGYGRDLGTREFLLDLSNGLLIDPSTGEVFSSADFAVGVIPGEASNDLCKEYAGRSFPLDEASDIPAFPIHANCPHEIVVVPLISL